MELIKLRPQEMHLTAEECISELEDKSEYPA